MKENELNLLSCLRENSREKLTEISKKTNIPISTLFDMLKEMQGGVIKRSTVLLNFHELGYQAHAQVFLKINRDKQIFLRKHLMFSDNVNNIYKVNNQWDLMIETIHRNIKELDCFLEELKEVYGVSSYEINYLIEPLKQEGSFCFKV